MDKFLVRGLNPFSIQKKWKAKGAWGYYPEEGRATQKHFYDHFYNSGNSYGGYVLGSLAFRPSVEEELKWVCFDIDNPKQKSEFQKLFLPELPRYGLDCIIEHGASKTIDNLDRGKFWIPLHCSVDTARHLIFQLGEETGLNFIDSKDKETYYDEIFGVNKLNFVCRIPIGYHVGFKGDSEGEILPIEIGDELTTDPEEFIKLFMGMNQPREEELKPLLKPLTKSVVKPEVAKVVYDGQREFFYIPRNLPLPPPIKIDDLPPEAVKPVRNCQALRDVLDGIIRDNYLMDRVKSTHPFGLAWSGLCAYNDIKLSKRLRKHVGSGREFFRFLVNEYRDRDDEKHHWDASWKTAEKEGADRVFWSCQAMEKTFPGACDGCPFRGQIKSPKQFIYGKEVLRKMVGEMRLSTPEEIRKNTFPIIKDRIFQLVSNGYRGNLLVASVPGAGKSFAISEWAAELAKQGYKVLLAVPTADIAIEHRQRIREHGEEAFVHLSHKSTFAKKDDLGFSFDCPYFGEIQAAINIGVSSTNYKAAYCRGCPFEEKCYYPRQYSEVMEDQYKIVIIQHAHFSCQEVIYELAKKEFDVLFIDESFINSMYQSIKVHKWEQELLEKFDFRWMEKLVDWLRGDKVPKGVLNPSQRDLELVHKAFGKRPYRLPDLIRFYNQGRVVNKYTGIEVIYELPNIPVRIFTDGTPPVDLIKKLTGISNLEVWGDNEVLDVKRIHPDNEIIQVLDISSSRTFLEEGDNLENILTKIGEIVDSELKGKKVLVTVASYSMKNIVSQFFLDNRELFPTPITVNIMQKGVNDYKDYDAQFLLAGRYYRGIDYYLDTYKYKAINNYIRKKEGKDELNNPYPADIEENISIPRKEDENDPNKFGEVVKRIEQINNRGGIFEYEAFRNYPPKYFWHRQCYEYNKAETQQAIRLRFDSTKARKVWILNNYNLPSIIVTKSILYQDFLK